MVRVITLPKYPNGWPYHVDHYCMWCGTMYHLEPKIDCFHDYGNRVSSDCPICGRPVTTYKPPKWGYQWHSVVDS